MPWSFERKLRFGFWLLAFIPIVLGIVAFRNAYFAADAAEDVARTNEIVKSLEQFLSQIKDIEVAQREFVLTADERHVQGLHRSRERAEASLKELRSLSRQRHWLELLQTLVPQKLDEVAKTLELRRSQGLEAASQAILANRGQQAMDDIRRVVGRMISDEEGELRDRTAAQQAAFTWTLALFAVMLALNLALIWLIAYRVKREQHQIHALNEELEHRVELRTEALRRSNEDLQQFAYIASHDLKEPMRMISSYSTLLQRRYEGRLDGDADTYIGYIIDAVKRMNTLITDLLEYSRAGEVPDESLAPIDTEAVVRNVLSNLKVTIAEARAKVTVASLPRVTYDPMRLTQIFQNLIANAIKYCGDRRPEVQIGVTDRESDTVFFVKDNGIGIDPENQEKIFGIFQRLHGKEYEGSGIGLAMVKKIVERQGGHIWVESSPGAGSTFYFSVPHSRPMAAESTTA
jgi:signal transduction histidine kinase